MTGWLWGGRGRDSVQRVPSVQQCAAAAKAPATRSLLGGRSRAPREQAGDNLQLPIRCPERRDAAGGSLPRPRSGYAGREHGQILRSTPFDGAFVAVARAAAGDAADHHHDGARQGADGRPRTQRRSDRPHTKAVQRSVIAGADSPSDRPRSPDPMHVEPVAELVRLELLCRANQPDGVDSE